MADQSRDPAHSHLVEFPEALETFFTRVGELRTVLGPGSGPGLARLEATIQEGLAAREQGDVPRAVGAIVRAMDLLATLAGDQPGLEGTMLRAMAEQFRSALARGSLTEAQSAADVMREQSGSRVLPRRPR